MRASRVLLVCAVALVCVLALSFVSASEESTELEWVQPSYLEAGEQMDSLLQDNSAATPKRKTVKRSVAKKPVKKASAPKRAAAPKKSAPKKAAPKSAAPASPPMVGSSSATCDKLTKAANYALTHVSKKQYGQGECAKFVGAALVGGGFKPITGERSACNKGAALRANGFAPVSTTSYQVGDIGLWSCVSAHPDGHLMIYSSKGWVSDHKQNRADPWAGGKTAGSKLTIYRLAPSAC